MVTDSATMTDLLRHPKDVVARADRGPVRITRRDADDLVLLRADSLDSDRRGAELAVRVARATLIHGGDMAAALDSLFPWTAVLSKNGRQRFAAEMDELVWASIQLGRFTRLLHEFASWEGTAEAIAAGYRPDDELDWYGADEMPEVPRPVA